MRGHLLDAALALALVVLQTGAGRAVALPGLHPDLLLLFVLAAGMRRGESAGALWGVGLGFLQDVFSAGLPGAGVLTKGLLGLFAGGLRGKLDCDNPNTQALVAGAATLAEGLAHLALLEVFSAGRGLLAPLLGIIVPASLAHAALLPAAVALRRGLERRQLRPAAARG